MLHGCCRQVKGSPRLKCPFGESPRSHKHPLARLGLTKEPCSIGVREALRFLIGMTLILSSASGEYFRPFPGRVPTLSLFAGEQTKLSFRLPEGTGATFRNTSGNTRKTCKKDLQDRI